LGYINLWSQAMLKNITLSAEERLIQRARERAERENTTLNEEFRRWLAQYAEKPRNTADFSALMSHLEYAQPGKTFLRAELNER
jgi:hypothetical protein